MSRGAFEVYFQEIINNMKGFTDDTLFVLDVKLEDGQPGYKRVFCGEKCKIGYFDVLDYLYYVVDSTYISTSFGDKPTYVVRIHRDPDDN